MSKTVKTKLCKSCLTYFCLMSSDNFFKILLTKYKIAWDISWKCSESLELTYWQPVCLTIWKDVLSNKRREIVNTVVRHVIWANPKTGSLVYRWLCAHGIAMFNITCFPTFVRASDDISSVLSILDCSENTTYLILQSLDPSPAPPGLNAQIRTSTTPWSPVTRAR